MHYGQRDHDFKDGNYTVRTEVPANHAANTTLELGPYRLPVMENGFTPQKLMVWIEPGLTGEVEILVAADSSSDYFREIESKNLSSSAGTWEQTTRIAGDIVRVDITPTNSISTAVPVYIKPSP